MYNIPHPLYCPLVTAKSTEAVDDYLKAILELSGSSGERVTSNALAAHLEVRAASVTGMLQKLAGERPSFVKYEKHHGVVLTELGKRRALEIQRHHRLLERFLHDVLDFPWDEVHDEAERLEHFLFINPRFIQAPQFPEHLCEIALCVGLTEEVGG